MIKGVEKEWYASQHFYPELVWVCQCQCILGVLQFVTVTVT